MGMLDESSQYPIYDMKTLGSTLVGEVWAEPKEMRQVATRFGVQDFYYIPILPKDAERRDANVVTLSVTPGARLAALSKAVKDAGDTDVRVGAKIAVKFSGTKPSDKGNDMHIWTWQYQPPSGAPATGMLADAGVQDDAEEMDLLGG